MEKRSTTRGSAAYPLIVSVEPVMFGVIRLLFDDGYEAVLDLRPLMQREIWKGVSTKDDFFAVEIAEHGDYIFWPASGGLAELPADGLRQDCERQQRIISRMYE